ncbi:MAG: ComF family protein [Candidatus Symbiothrix sp.]|jgi:ComF family protein|nr:ComF family protein [Candidatus Symbiothrix sp.]
MKNPFATMKLSVILKDFISLFYPQLCVVCSEALVGDELFFCSECLQQLPKTNHHLHPNNAAFEQLAGKFPIQKACAYLYYNKGGLGQTTITSIKYHGNIALGEWIGRYLAEDLKSSGFFESIECIIPVPLHKSKLRKRGFNQSEAIAKGISAITGIPMETQTLYRKQANTTQTKKGLYDRWKNTQGLFLTKDNDQLANQHILLLDDVLTTGSTLEACARALLQTPNLKISVLTVAIA